jgi:uncharacterized protein (DUF1697 family)
VTISIALLRGINVNGHNLIKMTDLKRMFAAMGFARVQTYIQSGNVLFESAEDAAVLQRRIEAEIQAVFGLSVPVVVRTTAELERVISDCPFPPHELRAGESLYVALLAAAPAQAGIDRLLAYPSDTDELRIAGREVYLLLRQGAHKTRFTNNFLEQKLGVAATTRNWQTINKLAALGRAMEA